MPVDFAKSVS